ncbi:MAG: hypothetical protein KAS32_00080 [Candidatus Peribacteraceae bacterium]|nr:hypothetical protein [Candidatus Peribacteraceae bacterium]
MGILTGRPTLAQPEDIDVLHIVDKSDTSDDPAGSSKQIPLSNTPMALFKDKDSGELAKADTTAIVEMEKDLQVQNMNLKPFIAQGFETQNIPEHDGLIGTEILISLDEIGTNKFWSATAGILTALKDANGLFSSIEFHVVKSGGGTADISFWIEISTDGGSTWVPSPSSLRERSFANDGDGVFAFGIGFNQPIAEGTKFRAKMTKGASGTISIEPPSDLVVSTGTADGPSARFELI